MKLPVFAAEWVASWKLLSRNILTVFAGGFLDVLFFISLGFLTAPVFDKLTEHVIIIGSLVSAQMQAAAGRARPAIIDALFQEPVSGYTWQFFGLLLLLAAVVFVLFWLFQGTAWWLAHGIAGKRHKWRQFLVSFGKVTSVWFLLYVVWYAIDLVLDLRGLLVEKATGQPAAGAGIVMFVILSLLVYFALLSCALLSVRKSLSVGARRVLGILPAMIVVLAHFLAGNFVVRLLGQLHSAVMFVGGVVLLVALLAWTRVYIARVVPRA